MAVNSNTDVNSSTGAPAAPPSAGGRFQTCDVCSGGDGAAAAGGAGGGRRPAGRPGAGEEGPGAGAEDRSERGRAHPGGGAERLRPAQVTNSCHVCVATSSAAFMSECLCMNLMNQTSSVRIHRRFLMIKRKKIHKKKVRKF